MRTTILPLVGLLILSSVVAFVPSADAACTVPVGTPTPAVVIPSVDPGDVHVGPVHFDSTPTPGVTVLPASSVTATACTSSASVCLALQHPLGRSIRDVGTMQTVPAQTIGPVATPGVSQSTPVGTITVDPVDAGSATVGGWTFGAAVGGSSLGTTACGYAPLP